MSKGQVTCPTCGVGWTHRTWLREAPTFPAFTVCFTCAAPAHVDVGPFGYVIRKVTADEAAHPEVAELCDHVVNFKARHGVPDE